MNNIDKNKNFDKTVISWYPGHMAKTRREIVSILSLVDIVYELIDARMPISSKIVDIDDLVQDKPRILIVTKYDLCDKEKTDVLLNLYRDKGYFVIVCDLFNKNDTNKILETTKIILSDKVLKRVEKGLKPRKARAVVIGVPNVGKSTLINQLSGKKVVQVANKPGVTRTLSWIRIGKDIELLDSPGILWPKIESDEVANNLAVLTSIKEDILDKEHLARYIVLKLSENYPDYLISRYNLNKLNIETIFEDIAKSKNIYGKGAMVDYDRVYSVIIKDLKDNSFGKVTFD